MKPAQLVGCFLVAASLSVAAHAQLASSILVPANQSDLFPGMGSGETRLAAFGSDLYYDPYAGVYYGLTDRGGGGGQLPFQTRVQQFTMDFDPGTGAISNFQLERTIQFKTADGSAGFDGRLPGPLHGNPSVLGLSLDPEAFLVGRNGNFFVGDEYGPSLYEFTPVDVGGTVEARFVRAFTTPNILIPRDNTGVINHDAVRTSTPPLVSGRQDTRGFEGLALTPDGGTMFAMVQGPLAEEGSSNQGRNSRNVRIVRFDVASGLSTGQFIYQLEDRAAVNARIDLINPDPAADITATGQGRNLALGGFLAINDHEFLIIERDNRGFGDENPSGNDPVRSAVGSKRVHHFDITGATDVSAISLRGTNALTTPVLPGNPDPPIDIVPVTINHGTSTPVIDMHAALVAAGLPIPEKFEGITIGPQLADGRCAVIVSTDNDMSMLAVAAVVGGMNVTLQFDIFTNGTTTRFTPLDDPSRSYALALPEDAMTNPDLGALPADYNLLPSYIYSFPLALPQYNCAIPEPASGTLAGAIAIGLAFCGWRQRRNRSRH